MRKEKRREEVCFVIRREENLDWEGEEGGDLKEGRRVRRRKEAMMKECNGRRWWRREEIEVVRKMKPLVKEGASPQPALSCEIDNNTLAL